MNTATSSARRPLARLIRTAVGVLIVVGLGISALRATYTTDLTARVEPLRDRILAAVGVEETNQARRDEAVQRIDLKFASNKVPTLLHVLAGATLLVLVPLQFATRGQAPYHTLHRWSGRAVATTAVLLGLSGLYFGVMVPFAGSWERIIVGAYGLYFLVALGIGWTHIRAHRTTEHRDWMIRMVAAALAITVARLVAVPFDILITERGGGPEQSFLLSIATGIALSIAGGELWVRSSRTHPIGPLSPRAVPSRHL